MRASLLVAPVALLLLDRGLPRKPSSVQVIEGRVRASVTSLPVTDAVIGFSGAYPASITTGAGGRFVLSIQRGAVGDLRVQAPNRRDLFIPELFSAVDTLHMVVELRDDPPARTEINGRMVLPMYLLSFESPDSIVALDRSDTQHRPPEYEIHVYKWNPELAPHPFTRWYGESMLDGGIVVARKVKR